MIILHKIKAKFLKKVNNFEKTLLRTQLNKKLRIKNSEGTTVFLRYRQMERVSKARGSMTSRTVSSLSLPFLDVTAASNPHSPPPSWMIYGVGLGGRPSGHHSKLGRLADRQLGWPFDWRSGCRLAQTATTTEHNKRRPCPTISTSISTYTTQTSLNSRSESKDACREVYKTH